MNVLIYVIGGGALACVLWALFCLWRLEIKDRNIDRLVVSIKKREFEMRNRMLPDNPNSDIPLSGKITVTGNGNKIVDFDKAMLLFSGVRKAYLEDGIRNLKIEVYRTVHGNHVVVYHDCSCDNRNDDYRYLAKHEDEICNLYFDFKSKYGLITDNYKKESEEV